MKSRIGWLLLFFLYSAAAELYADAALLLQQPHGVFGAFNPTGHTAIYLSRVCAESPTVMRRCHAGERGVVISRYGRIAGYDWIGIPLIPYLYAVEKPDQVPVRIDEERVTLLRDNYRRAHLQALIPDAGNGEAPKGDWTQLIGAAYDRKIYGFVIETGEAADNALIEYLNSHPNKKRFNILFRNCADFSKDIINFYYPKAVRRSILADAGITTPKQIAKSLVQFSERRPDLQFSTFTIPQVLGDMKRSKPVRGILESLIRSKKYAVPLAVVYPWVAVGGSVAYLTGGRFNPEKYAAADCQPDALANGILASSAESRCAEKANADAHHVASDTTPSSSILRDSPD
jgi:hypothetical protein